MSWQNSRISSNSHLPTTATSLQWPHFLVPVDGPYIYSYFRPSTTASSPQWQKPLKRIPNKHFPQWPVKLSTTDEWCLSNPVLYYKRSRNLIRTAHRWSYVSVWFLFYKYWYILIVLGITMLESAFFKYKNVVPPKKQVSYYTPASP